VFGGDFGKAALLRAYRAVLLVSIVGLVINDAVIWLWVGALALPLLPGKMIATLVALMWNFLMRRLLIYPQGRA
jgi:putative flippase GtrA